MTEPGMSAASEPELAEDGYFEALIAGDAGQVAEVLAEDFLIVDVMSGSVADRAAFVAALRDGRLSFERVQLVERLTRRYGDTAIIVGRTEMSGSFDATSFAVASRYTHVFVLEHDGRWRLATTQGTSIAGA